MFFSGDFLEFLITYEKQLHQHFHIWDLAKCGWDLAKCLESLAVNAKVATLLSSIPASSDTVESEDEAVLNNAH